jgi:hypothetical protein
MKEFFLNIWHIIYPIKPIEAILTVFALFAWSRVYLKFRANLMNQKELAFWSILWFSVIIIVFVPGKTTVLANFLGMGRGFDALAFIAIIALFYAVYRLYSKTNDLEREITELVRQISLRHQIKKKKK